MNTSATQRGLEAVANLLPTIPRRRDDADRHWLLRLVLDSTAHPRIGDQDIPATVDLETAWDAAAEARGTDHAEVAALVARRFRLELADLEAVDPRAIEALPQDVAQRLAACALGFSGRTLEVAVSDPTRRDLVSDLVFASGHDVRLSIAPPRDLAAALELAYRPEQAVTQVLADVAPEFNDVVELTAEETPELLTREEVEAEPIVRLVNTVIHMATAEGASDVHLQPGDGEGVVRLRVDGRLRTALRMPLPVLTRALSRIKVMARLDITDRLRPQDGRATILVKDRPYELRISTVPTRRHEKAVIRILDATTEPSLEQLGIPPTEVARIRQALAYRDGLFVVTGPTGSGKTTTLHAVLREMAPDECNIVSVEDPVEREIASLTQLQVEEAQGFTFPVALRAVLRQDPDVIVVGEIRDPETAAIAARASLAGHLVLATLHTNDAVGVLGRLEELGVDRSVIAEILRGSLAQRLVRALCSACATPADAPWTSDEQKLIDRHSVQPGARAVGCAECGHTGYAGRIPVLELLTLTDTLVDDLLSGTSARAMRRRAQDEGMVPLRASGLARVKAGETTLDEVERVVSSGGPLQVRSGRDEQPTVLVVDDDPGHRALVRHLLEAVPCRVAEAADGEQAMALLGDAPRFDLVLLDLLMPGLSGREVLTNLRAAPGGGSPSVVVVTGDDNGRAEVELLRAGADDFVRKPLEAERFVSRVEAALRRRAR